MPARRFIEGCPDGCPPADAVDANGSFYRLVSNDPPSKTDFLTYAEQGLGGRPDDCLRYGLSVFDAAEAAAELYHYMQRRHPQGTRLGSLVALLQLRGDDGKTKQTGRQGHHTWWMYRDTDRAATFREVVMDAHDALGHS